jgi:hypothetical protein
MKARAFLVVLKKEEATVAVHTEWIFLNYLNAKKLEVYCMITSRFFCSDNVS